MCYMNKNFKHIYKCLYIAMEASWLSRRSEIPHSYCANVRGKVIPSFLAETYITFGGKELGN